MQKKKKTIKWAPNRAITRKDKGKTRERARKMEIDLQKDDQD